MMSTQPISLLGHWLLAATRRSDRIGRRFQPDEAVISFQQFVIVIVALLVGTILAWFIANQIKKRREQSYDNPRRLFRELCRAHALSNAERKLLHQIAGFHQLANPNQLFVERELFDAPALATAIGNRDNIDSLRGLLFDESPDSESTRDGARADTPLTRFRRFLADRFAD
jgi:hypothetical protein